MARLLFLSAAGLAAAVLYFKADIKDYFAKDSCLDAGGCWASSRRVCVRDQAECGAEGP